MTLNAFWGKKKVIIVNDTNCNFAKAIVQKLRAENFNNVEEMTRLDYAAIAKKNPDYVLVVNERETAFVNPFRTEGFVGDRVGHYVKSTLDRNRARELFAQHFDKICLLGSEQIPFEQVKRIPWYYDDKNMTPFLKLEAKDSAENVRSTCESIKDYFRK